MGWRRRAVAALAAAFVAGPAVAQDVRLPVLVPLTGFVALEGTSQRNGALLAAGETVNITFGDRTVRPAVIDGEPGAAPPSAPPAAPRKPVRKASGESGTGGLQGDLF